MFSISTPIKLKIEKEKIINKSPIIAAVSCSCAPFILSGSPWEVVSLYPDIIISNTASPPAIDNTILKISLTRACGSVFISPSAVGHDVPPDSSQGRFPFVKPGPRMGVSCLQQFGRIVSGEQLPVPGEPRAHSLSLLQYCLGVSWHFPPPGPPGVPLVHEPVLLRQENFAVSTGSNVVFGGHDWFGPHEPGLGL